MSEWLTTDRDHENNPNDVTLISGLGVIEKVPVNVKNGQSDSCNGANESDDVEEKRNQKPHSLPFPSENRKP